MQNISKLSCPIDPGKTIGVTTFSVTSLPSAKVSPRLLQLLPNALNSVLTEFFSQGYDTLIFTLDNVTEIDTAELLLQMKHKYSFRMILLSSQPRNVLLQWLGKQDLSLIKRYSDLVMQADGEIVISPVSVLENFALLCQEYLREHCSIIIRP